MRDGARVSAALSVVRDVRSGRRPAKLALRAWGEGARYAGAKDRAFVSGLALDALRRARSLGFRMSDPSDRAIVLGALRYAWDWPAERVAEAAAETPHGPGPLTDAERTALSAPADIACAPLAVRADLPDWIVSSFERAYGEQAGQAGAALATRAPTDIRINTLRTDPTRALKVLAPFGVRPAGILTTALRCPPPPADSRAPALESAPEFAKGWFEIQDLGSQIAAAAAGRISGGQVLDLCAGGGGKTLALAAAMGNSGQLYAYDSDARRLSETVTRARRAGVRNLQVRSPLASGALDDLVGRMDVVFVDAPCTGVGTWRRRPDAKWRLTPAQLEARTADQAGLLEAAARFVKPGGRIVYVTCSPLVEEDEDRVDAALSSMSALAPASALEAIQSSGLLEPGAGAELERRLTPGGWLRLAPHAGDADGFFIAVLTRTR